MDILCFAVAAFPYGGVDDLNGFGGITLISLIHIYHFIFPVNKPLLLANYSYNATIQQLNRKIAKYPSPRGKVC